jgi:serine/threonine protein kinase
MDTDRRSPARVVDEECDRFEADWRAGRKTPIECYVERAAVPDRRKLFRELLALELELRRNRGERPTPEEYRARFPAEAEVIAATFASIQMSQTTLDVPGRGDVQDTDGSNVPGSSVALGAWSSSGRFHILQFHARGGLGEVFIARDRELERTVALKEIQSEYADDSDFRARFLQEAEITGALEHPGVVPVYGLGSDRDGRPFYAMRFIRGESLKESIVRFHAPEGAGSSRDPGVRNLALRQLLGRFVAVCNVIAYAHSRGILHRDLKPGNIMLGAYGETLVVDWGLAKPMARPETSPRPDDGTLVPVSRSLVAESRAGEVRGTPGYMSPEQAAGSIEDLGPGADVYSLGATLYSLLTGRAPIPSRDAPDTLGDDGPAGFLRPRQVDRRVPLALEAICLKALAQRPPDRYISAQALAGDLEQWLADEPVAAYREPVLTRLFRWIRRHKPLVAGVAAVVVTAAVGLAVHDVRIAQEKARVEAARKQADADFQIARAAVDQVLSRVAAGDLVYLPRSEPLRRELAGRALAFYQKFLEAHRDDPAVRFDAARAYQLVANIGRLTGQDGPPQEHYDNALGLVEGLTAEHPDQSDYRRRHADILVDRGEYHRMNGRPRLAERDYRKALSLMGPRAAETLDRRTRAVVLFDLASALNDLGRFAEARGNAEESVALLEPMADGAQPVSLAPLYIVKALGNVGRACRESGDVAGAEKAYGEAVRRARALMAKQQVADPIFALASVLDGTGQLLGPLPGRSGEASTHFHEAVRLLNALVKTYDHIPLYRRALASALIGRGGLLGATSLVQAEADCARAARELDKLIAEALALPDNHGELGRCFTAQSRIARRKNQPEEARRLLERALAEHEAALKTNPDSAADLERARRLRAELAEDHGRDAAR